MTSPARPGDSRDSRAMQLERDYPRDTLAVGNADRYDLAALIESTHYEDEDPSDRGYALALADAILAAGWFNSKTIDSEEAEGIFKDALGRVR